jgi:O-antigen ligase
MKQSAPVNKLAARLSWLVVVILAILPFHAFITVWLSSLVGHYTLLRLWKEFLLVPIVAGALFIILKDGSLRRKLFSVWLIRLIAAYCLLLLVCAVIALNRHAVSPKAMWYGLLIDLRFLVFFLAVLILASKSNFLANNWPKILLIPAVIVGAFAILQFLILPTNFLSHFGYGPTTISPYETINHNIQHIRVESTLRGANPLGAYLLVPICALAVSFFKDRHQRFNLALFGFGLFLALVFSFSRSAWIGAALGVLTAAWLSFKSERVRKNIGWSLAAVLVVGAALTLVLRNNLSFENAVFHTDRVSKAAQSSNQGHSAAFKSAAKDIIHHPLGSGVGTAGPQSVYNDKPARIAENYYLQIGQEAGVLGMMLFIAICVVIGKLLFKSRANPLSLALFASLIGLSFVNLLSHAWSDDTLAYIWWGLAAIALGPAILTDSFKHNNGQKIKKP